ncbi:hypothetical protein ABR738_18545 [Streptomyces sp. Edi4]|uniref:hypothetical protein n=1 Tax=Streptomyces sp. Edi4 TaxID=3162527 RepID=UPI0033057A9A
MSEEVERTAAHREPQQARSAATLARVLRAGTYFRTALTPQGLGTRVMDHITAAAGLPGVAMTPSPSDTFGAIWTGCTRSTDASTSSPAPGAVRSAP